MALFGSGAVSLLRGSAHPNEYPGFKELPLAAAGTCFATIVYCIALSIGVVPYWLATFAYLAVNIPLLAENRRSLVLPALLVGIVFGGGLHLIFTHVLVTDLP